MAARPPPFRQIDVSRAVKGALAAGLKIGRVEIRPDGGIVVVSGEALQAEPASDFDRWKASRDARQA